MVSMQKLLTNCSVAVGMALCCLAIAYQDPAVATESAPLTLSPSSQHASINLSQSREPIRPIVSRSDLSPAKVALGEKLFNDRRLDSNQHIACGDCHNLELGGTDQLAFSVNGAGNPTRFNTPFSIRALDFSNQ